MQTSRLLLPFYELVEGEHKGKYACLYQNISPCVSAVFISKQISMCFINIPVRRNSFQVRTVNNLSQECAECID